MGSLIIIVGFLSGVVEVSCFIKSINPVRGFQGRNRFISRGVSVMHAAKKNSPTAVQHGQREKSEAANGVGKSIAAAKASALAAILALEEAERDGADVGASKDDKSRGDPKKKNKASAEIEGYKNAKEKSGKDKAKRGRDAAEKEQEVKVADGPPEPEVEVSLEERIRKTRPAPRVQVEFLSLTTHGIHSRSFTP
jgi:hypothetical protein